MAPALSNTTVVILTICYRLLRLGDRISQSGLDLTPGNTIGVSEYISPYRCTYGVDPETDWNGTTVVSVQKRTKAGSRYFP